MMIYPQMVYEDLKGKSDKQIIKEIHTLCRELKEVVDDFYPIDDEIFSITAVCP